MAAKANARPMTLVKALKAGRWSAAQTAHQLDDEPAPDCSLPCVSTSYVWDSLRELQLAYQERYGGQAGDPCEFERLARVLPVLAAIGA